MKSVTSALATAMVCTLSNTGSCQAKVYLGNWDYWVKAIYVCVKLLLHTFYEPKPKLFSMLHTQTVYPTSEQTLDAAQALASALGNSFSYAIVGGTTFSLLGSGRQTEDIDFVVPQGTMSNAHSVLRQSTDFQVQPRTNHTTYIFTMSEIEPTDIEILTPPSLSKGEYTTQSHIVLSGKSMSCTPLTYLQANVTLLCSDPPRENECTSDCTDIAFLLDYIIKHEELQVEDALERLRKVVTKEWIVYYLQTFTPGMAEKWVKLGLYATTENS